MARKIMAIRNARSEHERSKLKDRTAGTRKSSIRQRLKIKSSRTGLKFKGFR